MFEIVILYIYLSIHLSFERRRSRRRRRVPPPPPCFKLRRVLIEEKDPKSWTLNCTKLKWVDVGKQVKNTKITSKNKKRRKEATNKRCPSVINKNLQFSHTDSHNDESSYVYTIYFLLILFYSFHSLLHSFPFYNFS